MFGFLTWLFERKPKVQILTLDDGVVDFVVEDSKIVKIVSVPRKELVNSEVAQTYSLNGVKVVDIQVVPGSFKDLPRSGYEIHLSTGIKYYT